MSILYYDHVVFQTTRPALTTVKWQKVEIVAGVPVALTSFTTTGVVEVTFGNYAMSVPIEDTDPDPTYIVMNTGDGSPLIRVVKALSFDPDKLARVFSGGGILSARVADSSLAPSRFLEVIQGEEKVVTFIVEANGRFVTDSPAVISAVFKDPEDNVVEKEDSEIDRVCEALDIQVIRVTLTPEDTMLLTEGLLIIELSFDDQKARLLQALKVIPTIAPVST